MGNLRSVEKAVQHLGFACRVQPDLEGADALILPGVGAFGAAMRRLEPLRDPIRRHVESGKPLLGICLGQQLLFDSSEEFGDHPGLGVLKGRVRYFPAHPDRKVPHMGWNALEFVPGSPLGEGVGPGEQAYFVHSLYTECEDEADIAARTRYGLEFASAVRRENVWGCQFHPEKSGAVGLRILSNYLRFAQGEGALL